MVSSQSLIYNIKISSVGPANATGSDLVFGPGGMDLAVKLHYIRGIYYFEREAFEGLDVLAIKEPMFTWLNKFPVTCGRFRRDESGRAFIKCNDCGVRFIEAKCDKTVDEWLESKDSGDEKLLVSDKVIGPELGFSPLVLIQLTKFKCGGTALGLSWAHVLGDPFSAADFMNMLGRAVARHKLGEPINPARILKRPTRSKVTEDPLSIKRVGPVGDYWVHEAESKLETLSFSVTQTQLSNLRSKLSPNGGEFTPFEAISALIWKCIARIRGEEIEPNVVTICKRSEEKNPNLLSNSQIVAVVRADVPVIESEIQSLAKLLKNEAVDERESIEEVMERENGLSDFIVYGANLTFVDLEDAEFYGFEYRGRKPVRVSWRIDGVGDQGAVLVIPGPNDGGGGREVVAILPEDEIVGLKEELKKEGIMA